MAGCTELHKAVAIGDIKLIEKLIRQDADMLDAVDDDGKKPIDFADDREVLKILVAEGAKKDKIDQLAYCVKIGGRAFGRFLEVIIFEKLKTQEQLTESLLHYLKKYELVNQVDSNGKTALHYAVKAGDVALIDALIRAGANVNCADIQGRTPLHYTLDAKNGAAGTEAALALLKAGADIYERHPNNNDVKIAVNANQIHDPEFPTNSEDESDTEDEPDTEEGRFYPSVYECTQKSGGEKNENTAALIQRYDTLSTIGSVALGIGCVIGVLAAVALIATVVVLSHGVALLPLLAVGKSLFVPSAAASAGTGMDILAGGSLLGASYGVFKGAEKLIDTPEQRPQSFAASLIGWFRPSPKGASGKAQDDSSSNLFSSVQSR